jgi:hypothetical protein
MAQYVGVRFDTKVARYGGALDHAGKADGR